MTFEEAKKIFLNRGFIDVVDGVNIFDGDKWREACIVISDFLEDIKTLEQEPCDEAISRQAVKRLLEDRFMELQKRHDDKRYETNYCLNTILELPPVNPQPKTGHWEEDGYNLSDNWIFTGWKCSVCGKHALQDRYDRYLRSDYCPNCGSRMVDPQESEVKDE